MAHVFTVLSLNGQPAIVQLSNPSSPLPMGWALITFDEEEENTERCVLWMIYVREKYRRQGFGRAIIAHLQDSFNEVVTQYERGIVNSAGTQLCVSCGFEMKPQIHKKHPPLLVWKKKEAPAPEVRAEFTCHAKQRDCEYFNGCGTCVRPTQECTYGVEQ